MNVGRKEILYKTEAEYYINNSYYSFLFQMIWTYLILILLFFISLSFCQDLSYTGLFKASG